MRQGKRHRQPLEVMASMNITNLLDTAFILLITFMLVAPQLTHGLKMNVPTVKDAPNLDVNPSKNLLISIAPPLEGETDPRIIVGGDRVTVDGVTERVEEELLARPDLRVVLETDETAQSGVFVQVIGAVKRAGIDEFGIRTTVVPQNPENR